MYLREIQVENFKSFGKAYRIPFRKGFTAITGPNGSGKSNVSDSILFVLGPKSSKAIRAGKLTDLIFDGGKSKKPAKYCKVSLVFDNIDRIIPIDSDTVELTRHVKLSPSNPEGYNSYFYVNGRKSSLGEFDTLLANARISAEGYNLVQQGDITRIVNMSSVERRKVLDGIAGITKFDNDISKADNKRTRVEENLGRIDTILGEIKTAIAQLQKDRGVAIRYRETKDKLDLAKAQLAYKHKELSEEKVKTLQEQITKKGKEKDELALKQKELDKKMLELTAAIEEVEQEIADQGGEEAQKLKEKLDGFRLECARAKDAIESAKETITDNRSEKARVDSDLTRIEKELTSGKQKQKELQKNFDETKKLRDEKAGELKDLQDGLAGSDSKASVYQKEVLRLQNEIEDDNDRLSKLSIEADRQTAAIERLTADIASLENTQRQYETELKDADYGINEVTGGRKGKKKSIKEVQETFHKKRAEEKRLSDDAKTLENSLTEAARRHEFLKAQSEAIASVNKGFNNAVSSILDVKTRGLIRGIHGTVSQLAKVKKEHETALYTAAGNRLQAIVVDTDETAARCIEYLKTKKLGRATFLPLKKMLGGNPRGKALMVVKNSESLGFALDLVTYKEEYRNAFWYVYGDTIVMKNLAAARTSMGGVRLVTLDGELIEASGAMQGGTALNQKLKFGAGSQSEMETLGSRVHELMDALEKTNKQLTAVRDELKELEDQLRTSAEDSASQVKLEMFEAKKKEFTTKVESARTDITQKNSEIEKARAAYEKATSEKARIEEGIEAKKAKKEESQKRVIASTPGQLKKQLSELSAAQIEFSNTAGELKSRLDTITNKIGMDTERFNELKAQSEKLGREISNSDRLITDGAKSVEKFETEIAVHRKMEEAFSGKMKQLSKKRDAIIAEKADVDKSLDKTVDKVHTTTDIITNARISLEEETRKLAEYTKEIETIKLENTDRLPTLDDLTTTIKICEKKLDDYGVVNLRAIEDYDAQEKRLIEVKDEAKRLTEEKGSQIGRAHV